MKITARYANDAFSIEVRKTKQTKARVVTVKPVKTVFTYERALTLSEDFEKLMEIALNTKLEI